MSVKTNIHKVLFYLLSLSFIFIGCEKDKEDNSGWENCLECTTESWVGEYSGKGDYNNFNNNTEMKDADVFINIEETANDYLTIYIQVPSLYTATVSGDLSSSYIVSFAGSNSSVTAIMFIKDSELKLTGNSKKFHYKVDSLIIDQVITFETIKNQ